jgi:beta-lactam-binding protein with PASTA domain
MTTWFLLFVLYAVAPHQERAPTDAPTVIVPHVLLLPLKEAEAKLADAKLRLGRVTAVPNENYARGIVVTQSPDGGTRVRINYECELYVSTGPKEP